MVVVPSNVTDIPSGALKRCESLGGLATLKIPDSISTMDVWDCKDVSCPLNGCSGATLGTRYCSGYDGVHAGRDAFKDAGSTTVVCVYTDGAAITNNTWAPSCELECNRGYSFPAFEQLQPTHPAPRECTRCPFPKRCPGGSATDPACKEGSQGPGCVQCSRKWFTFGHRCAECPETAVEGLVSFLAGLAAVAIFVVKVWGCTALQVPVSKLEEQRKKFNNRVTNLKSNIETGKQQKSELEDDNFAAFLSIHFFHLQLSAINFSLPGFPFPGLLRAIAQWMKYLFSLDFGSSVECFALPDGVIRNSTAALTVILGKSMMLLAGFTGMIGTMWLLGKCTGHATR